MCMTTTSTSAASAPPSHCTNGEEGLGEHEGDESNQIVVCASAPGKVILFGEHAVVYGQPAIAASLSDLRIYVKVRCTHDQKISIIMPDLPTPVHFTASSEQFQIAQFLHEPPTKEDTMEIQYALSNATNGENDEAEVLDETAKNAITPLIYLLNRLVPIHLEEGLEICVRSQDLPVGAGLGSSAAFGVACAAALVKLSYSTLTSPPSSSLYKNPEGGQPSSNDLETINTYAYYSEILLHGTPSGIDNAVSTFGGAIVFTKGDDNTAHQKQRQEGDTTPTGAFPRRRIFPHSDVVVPSTKLAAVQGRQVNMEFLKMPPLEMILTHTHVPRSTKALVRKVKDMYNTHTKMVQGMLDAMGAIATQFRELVVNNDPTNFDKHGGNVMTLVQTNQHLLRAVGVSHPSLDYICRIVDEISNGQAATKLTGAGGGGCACTLLRPGEHDKNLLQTIQHSLERPTTSHPWKFRCLTSCVGGDGVLWNKADEFPKDQPSKTQQRQLDNDMIKSETNYDGTDTLSNKKELTSTNRKNTLTLAIMGTAAIGTILAFRLSLSRR